LGLGLEKYQKGIRYLNEDPNLEKEPAETKKALDALRYSLNSNSALLANKLKDFHEALRSADAALEVAGLTNAEKAKALFRRAVANIGLKDEDSALADLEVANALVPEDGAVKLELNKVKKAAVERAKKEKAAYSKFFS
jgi:peptidyl-prolyl isomerase D